MDPLTLFAVVAGSAAAVGFALGRRARARVGARKSPAKKAEAPDPLATFPYRLGDVLVRRGGEDALLSSALVLVDGAVPIAAIFGGGGASSSRVVVAFPPPRDEVLWLDETIVDVPSEPPSTLLAKGDAFDRKRLVPVRVTSLGDAPKMDPEAKFAEYEGTADTLVLVKGPAEIFVARGERVPSSALDRLPGPSSLRLHDSPSIPPRRLRDVSCGAAFVPLDRPPSSAPAALGASRHEGRRRMEANARGESLASSAAIAVLGSAAFGIAAGLGHGVRAMATGAWAAPLVFLGGAALATPPLYLFGALASSRRSGAEVLRSVSHGTARVATALLGLAAPAAFFSVTLRGFLAEALLVGTACIVGGAGVVAVVHATSEAEETDGAKLASAVWLVVALALGVKLVSTVGHAAGLGV